MQLVPAKSIHSSWYAPLPVTGGRNCWDEAFKNLSLDERKYITAKILDDVRGRMLEEIVLLEAKKSNPEKQVFKLQFAVGEFDMVVFDEERGECEVFEIKHTNEPFENQMRHLLDEKKLKETSFRYGKIIKLCVLYRGKSFVHENSVVYQNMEKYLCEKN